MCSRAQFEGKSSQHSNTPTPEHQYLNTGTALSKDPDLNKVVLKTKVKLKLNGVLKTFRETIYSDGRVERVEITNDEE